MADTIKQPLTDAEIEKLRKMLTSEERVQWAWATARTWATWIAAVGLGVTVGWDWVVRLVKAAAAAGPPGVK